MRILHTVQSCRLYDAVNCCGKLEKFGLQHSVPEFKRWDFLPDLPSNLRSLKLSVCEAVDDMVMWRYKDLKALDLEFTFCRDMMPSYVVNYAVINQRSYALFEVSYQRIMPISSFTCME